jgi:hypothetical protein
MAPMFTSYDQIETLARRTDPITSKISAAELRGTEKLKGLRSLALKLITEHPLSTMNEITELSGLKRETIGPRFAELKRLGKIESPTKRPCGITGKTCLTWRVVE